MARRTFHQRRRSRRQAFREFKEVIDAKLAKRKGALASGTKATSSRGE